ncbi:MAG: 16S rRNA (cytosine(1402)-N(4))-methyltransferase RsmH [candidate division NC10 bacterium]|nr:16S rRNA (cytosine(1402)-N(4))-methyltransferase RsmH [candidate division NC10 bacterium]MCH7897284.1 16S rRNA (cytosine(1402)-N(4))-methyltransferase RsmH [candidate division NC10 bacterium]MCZ6551095.1 16S rRNA (cytosine(1402)-N(4))-methyltransferase RsmH [candidate division NC10 bacterium]
MKIGHIPVLVREVLATLQPRAGGVYLDCTVGGGGHAEAILEAAGPPCRVVGIDRDPEAIRVAAGRLGRFGDRVRLVREDFRELPRLVSELRLEGLNGVLFDLGVSSLQIGDPSRGFSFSIEGPLDMRMDRESGAPAARELLHELSEERLARIIREYGEERWARQIARWIVSARRQGSLETTRDLAAVVTRAIPRRFWPRRIHPATRTFQAIRIAVNQELDGLEEGLERAAGLLKPGGRIVVISFHSLEDRVVKHLFRRLAARGAVPGVRILTRRPVTPTAEETAQNPRARSGKLRAAERREMEGDV